MRVPKIWNVIREFLDSLSQTVAPSLEVFKLLFCPVEKARQWALHVVQRPTPLDYGIAAPFVDFSDSLLTGSDRFVSSKTVEAKPMPRNPGMVKHSDRTLNRIAFSQFVIGETPRNKRQALPHVHNPRPERSRLEATVSVHGIKPGSKSFFNDEFLVRSRQSRKIVIPDDAGRTHVGVERIPPAFHLRDRADRRLAVTRESEGAVLSRTTATPENHFVIAGFALESCVRPTLRHDPKLLADICLHSECAGASNFYGVARIACDLSRQHEAWNVPRENCTDPNGVEAEHRRAFRGETDLSAVLALPPICSLSQSKVVGGSARVYE